MNENASNNATPQPGPTDARALISGALYRVSRLAQNEFELAKRELAHKASRAFAGLLMVVAAIFLVFSALDILTAAAVAGLAEAGLPVSVASLVVAGIALALAATLFFVGKSRLHPNSLKLDKSVRNLRKDINTLKENAHV
ncbi:MAG: phage holin family protein [Roseobacter sp.]